MKITENDYQEFLELLEKMSKEEMDDLMRQAAIDSADSYLLGEY